MQVIKFENVSDAIKFVLNYKKSHINIRMEMIAFDDYYVKIDVNELIMNETNVFVDIDYMVRAGGIYLNEGTLLKFACETTSNYEVLILRALDGEKVGKTVDMMCKEYDLSETPIVSSLHRMISDNKIRVRMLNESTAVYSLKSTE